MNIKHLIQTARKAVCKMKFKPKFFKVRIRHITNVGTYRDLVENKRAVPLSFSVGSRGWFVYEFEDDIDSSERFHRIQTSVVKDVIEDDNSLKVVTENTEYTFTPEDNDD